MPFIQCLTGASLGKPSAKLIGGDRLQRSLTTPNAQTGKHLLIPIDCLRRFPLGNHAGHKKVECLRHCYHTCLFTPFVANCK